MCYPLSLLTFFNLSNLYYVQGTVPLYGVPKGLRSPHRPLVLTDGPRTCVARYHPELKPASDLTILYHLINKNEGWNKKVVVGTVIQYTPRGNEDHHQR